MNNLSVSLQDYQNGAGEMSAGDMQELQKALSAGSITGRETADLTTASGSPLKVESLENSLKLITFKESDIVLWKNIPKLPAYNTVEEYNQLVSYGNESGGAYDEGETAEVEDSIYTRRSQLVKYYSVQGKVTHPMQLVNTMVGNVMQQEIKNKTLWLLQKVNKSLAFGDSSIVPQEFNGLYKQHLDGYQNYTSYYNTGVSDGVVVDCRGKSLREADLENGALSIIDNFGEASDLFASPKVLSNFVKKFHGYKLIQPNTPALENGVMGQRVKSFMSQYGEIDLNYDKFLKFSKAKTLSTSASSSKAPNAPTADVTTPKAVTTSTTTKFSGFNGDYYYAVSATNKFGESTLTNLATVAGANTKLAVAGTEVVDLLFTDGGGTFSATGYTIYRTEKSPSAATAAAASFYPLFTITPAQLAAGFDGGAAGYVRDRNCIIANTEKAFLIQKDLEVFSFKQLAPLMKMDLAITGPATPFLILLYGTPVLYAPKKMVVFVNVGEDLT